jgi:3-dehydro-L-gulonate 2-dehydrogenase
MLRISFTELSGALTRALVRLGFDPERAAQCARLFAETTRDGVYSHGVNRFPRFVATIRNGCVNVHARPERVSGFGAIERWDGKLGPGNLNAYECMKRAISLAREHGLGCVALAHTNHWMRGGTYGWQAADAGMIGMCWTNTLANLPPWGASDVRLGNNPISVAVPRPGGHVVLDMAMSQFSFGALEAYRTRGELLPVDGGFDLQGRLTRDPAAIEASNRALSIGYWKGSGLSLLLDLTAALLSGGLSAIHIPLDSVRESGLSQVFLAFNLPAVDTAAASAGMADEIVKFLQLPPGSRGERVRYPGERTLRLRHENTELGIPVEPRVWAEIQAI